LHDPWRMFPGPRRVAGKRNRQAIWSPQSTHQLSSWSARSATPSKRISLSRPSKYATAGELPSPSADTRDVRARHRMNRATSALPYRPVLPARRMSAGRRGTFTGQYHQPFCPGENTKHLIRPPGVTACLPMKGTASCHPPVLHDERELGTLIRPKRVPSRAIPAWPLRRRRLPFDAGCVPLSSSSRHFCTGTDPHR